MRLTCPNCGAQYEVPDDVIPLAGRDVQCSNCGDTWFQPHPTTQTDSASAEDTAAPAMPDPEDQGTSRSPEEPPAEFEEIEPPEISLADEDATTDPAEAEGDGAFDEAEAIIEFDQLVGGPAAITVGLGLFYIRVVELTLEPASG